MTDELAGLMASFKAKFLKAKYVAGLLLAMADLVEQAGARGMFWNTAEFLEARRATKSHQLVVRAADGKLVRLRDHYERWENVFRYERRRGGYPSSAAHATNQWDKHTDLLDALLGLSDEDLALLRALVVDHVMDALPEAPPSQAHGVPVTSTVDVVSLVERLVQGGPRSEKSLSAEIARTFPQFRPADHGLGSVRELLLAHATEIGAADEADGDVSWAHVILDDDPGLDEVESEPRSPLRRLGLRRYRSLVDVELELGDFTLLVGPNGAGKSNLLDALFRAARMTRFPPNTLFRGRNEPDRVRTYGEREPFSIEVEQAEGGGWRWTSGTALPVMRVRPIGPVARLLLEPRRIAEPSVSRRARPRVAADGYGVSTVLSDLASTDRGKIDQIIERVAQVLPGFADLRIPRAAASPTGELGHRLEARIGGDWVPADQLSDGTLLAIALHTVAVADEVRLLLVDDLDRGLHPAAQRRVLEQVQELAGAQGVQIVATTHSATVLDQVPPESVHLVRAAEPGRTVVRALTAHPEWDRWDMMRPGEFWTYIGEDWLVEG